MQKRGTIKDGDNCLTISLAGDQTYVKIFDSGGTLLREDYAKGASEVQHLAEPGRYKVESDGTIQSLHSARVELKSDAELLGL
jgi:hypothetical protein